MRNPSSSHRPTCRAHHCVVSLLVEFLSTGFEHQNASARVLVRRAATMQPAHPPPTTTYALSAASPPFEFARNVNRVSSRGRRRIAQRSHQGTSLKVTISTATGIRASSDETNIATTLTHDRHSGRNARQDRDCYIRAARGIRLSNRHELIVGASSYGLTVRTAVVVPFRSRAGPDYCPLYGQQWTIHRPGELVKSTLAALPATGGGTPRALDGRGFQESVLSPPRPCQHGDRPWRS